MLRPWPFAFAMSGDLRHCHGMQSGANTDDDRDVGSPGAFPHRRPRRGTAGLTASLATWRAGHTNPQ